jgi:hypothetical protein
VLSSRIQDSQLSFSDLMLFESAEAPAVPLEYIQDVSNHVAATNHERRRLGRVFQYLGVGLSIFVPKKRTITDGIHFNSRRNRGTAGSDGTVHPSNGGTAASYCGLTKERGEAPFNPLRIGLMSMYKNWFGPTR